MNDGQCIITVATRKRCKACRLAKCLEQGFLFVEYFINRFLLCGYLYLGMRADWILTDEERVNKRKKIEDNRRLRRLLYPDSSDTDEVRLSQSFLFIYYMTLI